MQITNMRIEEKVIYPELSFVLVGIFFEVHNELGRYCNEKQYCDLIESKLKERKINHEREKTLEKYFPEEKAGRHKIDFLIENKIVIEVKATNYIGHEGYFQTRRYLGVLNKKLAILVNFRDKFLRPRRILNSSAST